MAMKLSDISVSIKLAAKIGAVIFVVGGAWAVLQYQVIGHAEDITEIEFEATEQAEEQAQILQAQEYQERRLRATEKLGRKLTKHTTELQTIIRQQHQ